MTKIFNAILIYLTLCTFVIANEDNIIKSINVDGLKRISYETVLTYSLLEEGSVFTDDLSNSSIKSLYDTQLFSDVSITFNEKILTITVIENPTINLVSFEGNKKKKDDDLISEIKLTERSVFSRSKVKEDVKRLLELYQRSGRLSSTIDPSVELLDNNRVNLIFKINESDVSKVSKISYIGNIVYKDRDLKKIMTTKNSSLLRFFSSKNNYDPDRIEYDKQLITDFYNKNGYVNFKFVSSIAQLINNKNFEIIFSVDEGSKFNFGKITTETKLEKLSADIIRKLIPALEDETFNSELLKTGTENIKNSAAQFGYTFIKVEPVFDIDPIKKIVNVNYLVDEGPKVYINRVNIYGNTRTVDKVIRRELPIDEGDPYNKYNIEMAKNKVRALQYFSEVEINEERISDTDKLNLNMTVSEKNTGSASLGAGYSDSAKGSLTLGLSEDNFLGKGQKVKVKAEFGSQSTLYDVSFTEPYFNNKQLSLRADIYNKIDDYDNVNYDTETIGLGFSLGFPLSNTRTIQTNYSLLTQKTTADANATAYETLLSGTSTISTIGYSLTIDNRNSPYKPTSGSLFTIKQTLAGIFGTSNYIENNINYKKYFPINETLTGAFKSEFGIISGYNGKYPDVNKLYKIGGKTLRGFKFGELGPKFGNSFTGGNLKYVLSTETNFDLPIDEYDISSSLFFDVGSVWGLDSRYGSINDDHKIRSSLGINLNWDSAIGPINFIFAEILSSEKTDSTDKFSFDIGYNF